MKRIYLTTLIFLISTKFIFAKELLLKHHMIFEEKVMTLNDGSTFNNFNSLGVWEDNYGNYGPANCQGVRIINKDKKIIFLNIVCQHDGKEDEKFWTLSKRDTSKEGGIGKVMVINTTKFFNSYTGYSCTYAVSFEKNIYIANSKCK